MSKYNPVYNVIWSSNRFSNLEFKSKLVFLYLLTNEKVSQTGIYNIALRHIECDTGLSSEDVANCVSELEQSDLIKYWRNDNLVFIKDNFKFARNMIKNSIILSKTIEGQRKLYINEELWEMFDKKYYVELEIINQSLIKQQSNKNNSKHNNHNKMYKEGIS